MRYVEASCCVGEEWERGPWQNAAGTPVGGFWSSAHEGGRVPFSSVYVISVLGAYAFLSCVCLDPLFVF